MVLPSLYQSDWTYHEKQLEYHGDPQDRAWSIDVHIRRIQRTSCFRYQEAPARSLDQFNRPTSGLLFANNIL
jgi:hypothetical protein